MSSMPEDLRREIEILKSLDHPNILRVYEFFDSPSRILIVTELLPGGELFYEITNQGTFTESKAAEIMRQIFSALAYLHERNIAHRDLKPENILLEEKGSTLNIKLVDFGAAVKLEKTTRRREVIGSSFYISPEALEGNYTPKCDMWSAGVILYILLSGQPPFNGSSDKEIFARVANGYFSMDQPIWRRVSESAKDLIRSLLQKNVSLRLDTSQAMQHAWMSMSYQPSLSSDLMQQVVSNLKAFHSTTKLKDAVYTYIASHCLASSDTKEMREAFIAIDSNGDGKLSRDELMTQYLKMMGAEQAEQEVEALFRNVDTDHSGYIDYTEFIKATVHTGKMLSKKNLETAFRLFDRDGSARISVEEIKDVLLSSNAMTGDDVFQEIVDEVDRNGDGEIDLKEFEAILLAKV
jgi:calcium-dependent protein kinase